jgi:branched-chain amino acid transport system substrate-binding protein
MYILKAKSPSASKNKWDLIEQVGVESRPEAFRPLDEGGCALVGQSNNN